MTRLFEPVTDDSLDGDDDDFEGSYDEYSEDDDEGYDLYESDDEEDELDEADGTDDATPAGASGQVADSAGQADATQEPQIPLHIQKQLEDLQRARAGAQRKLAKLEREMSQKDEARDLREVQMARRVVEAQLADEDDATRKAALANFDSEAQRYLDSQRTSRQQASQVQQARTTAAQQLVQSVGYDPQTGQSFFTEDDLLSQDFEKPEDMAIYAAQRAGILDYSGNPTAKYWQLQQASQQGQAPVQYAQPQYQPYAQPNPYQQYAQPYGQYPFMGGQMPQPPQAPAPAPAQQPPAKSDARQKRAKRRKDSFPNPKPVSQPRQEPSDMDSSINEFIQGMRKLSRSGGRRRR